MLWKLNAPSKESLVPWPMVVLKSRNTRVELMVMGKDMKGVVAFLGPLSFFKIFLGVVELATALFGVAELPPPLFSIWSGLGVWSRGPGTFSRGSSGLRSRTLEGLLMVFSKVEVVLGWLCSGEQNRETALRPPGTVWSCAKAGFIFIATLPPQIVVTPPKDTYTLDMAYMTRVRVVLIFRGNIDH